MGNAESRESTSQAAVADGNRPSRAASTAVTTTTPPVEDVTPRSQSLSARPNGQNVDAGGIERGQQATEEATAQLGYWYLLKNGYNELVNLIIRPPRATYELDDLGPDKFPFAGREYMRVDFTVVNDRQQTLQCSHWRPVQDDIDGVTEFPCVVYLHGNSSCRVEALSVLRTCLSIGVTVVAFDCAGCGKSDGEYISLGYFERDDVSAVIDHLRSQGHVSTIGLWGRSMGAATALLHADRDPSMAGLVVDSAFTSLEQLVQEIVEHGRKEGYTIPGFLVKIVMKFIRSSVLKRANFDLRELAPIEHASISFVPALFVAAKRDDFIAPHHSQQLHAQYAGDKNIVIVAGDHNSVRPPFLLDSAGIFLQTALQVDGRLVPDLHPPHAGHRMPWSFDSPKANKLRMMDLNVAFSGRYAKLVPKETWSCQVCTFVNEPLQMQVRRFVCVALYWLPW
ncbi:TPA: hypothetical protein N0F65_005049 [Lagenidium giganteum]|uniref:Serine aminopeptidase S33 domain-containing protein n=1 Tax=Lagenidium giganteum TaxID=4803 RepID=A0AAV2ZIA1_9STRA|nr:TPA: hypothetical protein N0F65_005049 [Lagenidium giganteum]